MDPQLVIFAIESAVKLGRKIYDVMIDQTAERPLLLPLGDLDVDLAESEAMLFFDRPENEDLVAKGGPYFGFLPAQKKLAWLTLLRLNERLEVGPDSPAAAKAIADLHAFRQFAKDFGAKSPAQRILGTVFEIGVDYFLANPAALGRDSNARRVIITFLEAIDETDLAEGDTGTIVADLLAAALRTVDAHADLVGDDKRLGAILGGVTKALLDEIGAAKNATDKIGVETLVKRMGGALIRGGLGAFNENLGLFLPGDEKARALVASTLKQVLTGIQDNDRLFTADTLELIFKSAVGAAAENAALFAREPVLQQLIARTLGVLSSAPARKLFTDETAAAVVRESLEILRENVETLIHPDAPGEHLLVTATDALVQSLASNLAGGGDLKNLLSGRQLLEVVRAVFTEVSRHPEQLLGEDLSDAKRTPLAQIIASVASALGNEPARLVNGATFAALIRDVLRIAVSNADQLLDLNTANPKTNRLFQAVQQLTLAVLEANADPRKLVSRDVFSELARRLLPLVSSNLDAFLAGNEPVRRTLQAVLALARGPLLLRTNGANLPLLAEQMLRAVLAGELKLEETNAVEQTARRILNTI